MSPVAAPRAPRSWRAALVLKALVLALPLAGAVIQTSCWFYYEDCDDDDDDYYDDDDDDCDYDDDDDHYLEGAPGAGPETTGGVAPVSVGTSAYRLSTYDVEPSTGEDPAAHPVRRVTRIEGLALAAEPAPTERDMEEFTRLVLFENWDLIGIPASAGRLAYAGVARGPDAVRVHYAQEDTWIPVLRLAGESDPAGLTFVLDRRGQLVEIDVTTRIRLD